MSRGPRAMFEADARALWAQLTFDEKILFLYSCQSEATVDEIFEQENLNEMQYPEDVKALGADIARVIDGRKK